jgi:hypothetical protein
VRYLGRDFMFTHWSLYAKKKVRILTNCHFIQSAAIVEAGLRGRVPTA